MPISLLKRWTREQCAPLEASGVFEQEHLELVDGELISRAGKSRPHVNVSTLLQIWLGATFGALFVNAEAPIDVRPEDNPTNEPVPDLIVLNRIGLSITAGNPKPKDLSLVVEISDSTLQFDRTVKAALYARAEIIEYWILDVANHRLYCHRDPVDGLYRSVIVYSEHESLAPIEAPSASFSPSVAFAE